MTSSVSIWVAVLFTLVLSVENSSTAWTGHVAPMPFATRLVYEANPLAGNGFYADPMTTAATAAEQTVPASAELAKIAATPQSLWLTENVPIDQVAAYVGSAAARGEMPVVVIYAIPSRDCGSFTAGGFGSAEDYRAWVRQVAAGLGQARVGVVLEPDALTSADCLSKDGQQERTGLLRDAVEVLTANPNAAVYVDAGHSRWLTPDELAVRLRAVGVDRARGFALNTSNFFTTDEEIAYGEVVSGLLGDAHYVIDTSRNGAGPAPDGPLNWCNPSERAVGSDPTTNTAGPHADAYLWIKHPGESDGDCNRGDPSSGVFMPAYAIDLARNPQG